MTSITKFAVVLALAFTQMNLGFAQNATTVDLQKFSKKALRELEALRPALGGGDIYYREEANFLSDTLAVDRNALWFVSPALPLLRGLSLIYAIDTSGRKSIRVGSAQSGGLSSRNIAFKLNQNIDAAARVAITKKLETLFQPENVWIHSNGYASMRFKNETLATQALIRIVYQGSDLTRAQKTWLSSHIEPATVRPRMEGEWTTPYQKTIQAPPRFIEQYFPQVGRLADRTFDLEAAREQTSAFREKGLFKTQAKIPAFARAKAPSRSSVSSQGPKSQELLLSLKEDASDVSIQALVKTLKEEFVLKASNVKHLKRLGILTLTELDSGKADEIRDFLRNRPEIKNMENGKTVSASAAPDADALVILKIRPVHQKDSRFLDRLADILKGYGLDESAYADASPYLVFSPLRESSARDILARLMRVPMSVKDSSISPFKDRDGQTPCSDSLTE